MNVYYKIIYCSVIFLKIKELFMIKRYNYKSMILTIYDIKTFKSITDFPDLFKQL